MSDIEAGANHTENEEQSNINVPDPQEAAEPNALEDPKVAAFLEAYKEKIEKAKKDKFTFLLVGRTGVGKSSSVNSLMGKEVAPVGDWEPTTMSVTSYDNEAFGINFTVIDTPGLCDDLEEEEKDYTYLKRIQEKASRFDCLWFVTQLNDTRVTSDEKRAIKLIGQAFGKTVWQHAVIIFTFANAFSPTDYAEAYEKRTKLIRQEIARWATPQIAEEIPSVAIDNKSSTIPNGEEWLGELYVTIFTRISDQGFLSFLLATATRLEFEAQTSSHHYANLNPSDSNEPLPSRASSHISLNSYQQERVAEKTQTFLQRSGSGAALGAATGVAIGIFAGPVGAVIGGAAGAVIGGLISFLERNKYMRRFLIVGQTGVGKSSFINAIFGSEAAHTSAFEACTKAVEDYIYQTSYGDICLIDTPGMREDKIDTDIAYLRLVQKALTQKPADITLYITRLNDTRFRADEKKTLELLTTHLGSSIWKNAWIVFTFAASVPAEQINIATFERLNPIVSFLSRTVTEGNSFGGFQRILRIDNVIPNWHKNAIPVAFALTSE